MPDVEIHKPKLDEASGPEVQVEYTASASPEEEQEDSSPEEEQQLTLFRSLKNRIVAMQETFRHKFNRLFSRHCEEVGEASSSRGREAVLREFENTDKFNVTKILSNIEKAVQNVLGKQGPSSVVGGRARAIPGAEIVGGQIEVKDFDQFTSTLEGLFNTMLRADDDIQNILKDDINRARRRARGAGSSREIAKMEKKLKKFCEGNRYLLELRDRIRKHFSELAEKKSTKETSTGKEASDASIATSPLETTETQIEDTAGGLYPSLEKLTEVPVRKRSGTLFDSTVPITGCQELLNNMDELATGYQLQAFLLRKKRDEKLKSRFKDFDEEKVVGAPGERELVGYPGERESVGSSSDEESAYDGQELDDYYYEQDLDDFSDDQRVADSNLGSMERLSPMGAVASERSEADIFLRDSIAKNLSMQAFKELRNSMVQLMRSEKVLHRCLEKAISDKKSKREEP